MVKKPMQFPTFEQVKLERQQAVSRLAEALVKALEAEGAPTKPGLRETDPGLRAAIEQHISAICELAKTGASAAWDIGAHYNALFERRHIRTPARVAARWYLDSRLKGQLGMATLRVYALVQKAFSKEVVDAFGANRLYHLRRFLRSQHKPLPYLKADFEALRIPVQVGGGEVALKLFSQCSEREIRRARGCVALVAALEVDADALLLDRVEDAIRQVTARQVKVRVAAVRARPALKLGAIYAHQLEAVARAILATIAGDKPGEVRLTDGESGAKAAPAEQSKPEPEQGPRRS